MTRVAVEIVRTLPAFDYLVTEQIADLVDGWTVPQAPMLSRGEAIAIRWARVTEELLAGCDAETVDAVLAAVDRVRAGMVR